MKTIDNKKPGFTLVELLVVLAIIGLLAAIGIPAILNAQRASRNTARLKQLEAVRNALSDYATKYNTSAYVSTHATACTSATAGSDSGTFATATLACVNGAATDPRAISVTANSNFTFTKVADSSGCTSTQANTLVQFYSTTSGSTQQLVLCREGGGTEPLTIQ